jgi:hypothetical protein
VSATNKPPGPQRFTVTIPTQSARTTGIAVAQPLPNDPFGAKRFERSKARTPQDYARVFNSISRELVELPLTRKQQDDIRAQRTKLEPEEVDKNIYRHPAIRERAPRDMPKRRKPGWVCRQFVLSASDRRRIDVSGQGSRGVCQSFEPASWHAPRFSKNSKFLRYRGAQFFVSGLRIEPVLRSGSRAIARSRSSVCYRHGLNACRPSFPEARQQFNEKAVSFFLAYLA